MPFNGFINKALDVAFYIQMHKCNVIHCIYDEYHLQTAIIVYQNLECFIFLFKKNSHSHLKECKRLNGLDT